MIAMRFMAVGFYWFYNFSTAKIRNLSDMSIFIFIFAIDLKINTGLRPMNIIGLMSGTSLDGVDMALCEIEGRECRLIVAETVPYTEEWRRRLATLEDGTALEYARTDVELGHYFGRLVNGFIGDHGVTVDAVASHGHTIFHQPEIGLTAQIGDGDAIAAETGLPVVSNFRTLDVALGGQGAPLVPVGDELLFGEYDACLNLGGIANISYKLKAESGRLKVGNRVAFDICPCNMVLNRLAGCMGLAYDPEGMYASRGVVREGLKRKLDGLGYYREEAPKSLGKEWVMSEFWPLVEMEEASTEDLLATVTCHVAGQIAAVIRRQGLRRILVTGGGAFNRYLVDSVSEMAPGTEIVVPDEQTVNFKEAIVFAFLGYLRLTNQVNTYASVTGARVDSIGGDISGIMRNKK